LLESRARVRGRAGTPRACLSALAVAVAVDVAVNVLVGASAPWLTVPPGHVTFEQRMLVAAGEFTLLLGSISNVSIPVPLAVIVISASRPGSAVIVPAAKLFSLQEMCASVVPTVTGSSPLGNANPKPVQLQFVPKPSGAAPTSSPHFP